MKSIFENAAYSEILKRLDALKDNTIPQWGKMNAAQMMAHCQEPLKLALEKSTLQQSGFLKRILFKSFKSSMYNDKPWKKNLPTAKTYKIINKKDFTTERNALHSLIEEFYESKNREKCLIHPVFGKFTPEQWGKLQYKHLDHHFRQFGV